MEALEFKTPYAEFNVDIRRKRYSNGRLALELIDVEDGAPVMTATVNIPEAYLEKDETIIKNYSENEGVLEFLIENKIVSEPVRHISNGWVTCPVVKIL